MNNRMLLRAQIITGSGTLMGLLSKTKELFQTAGNAVLSLICYNACTFSSLVSTIICLQNNPKGGWLECSSSGSGWFGGKKTPKLTVRRKKKSQSPLNFFSKPSSCTAAAPYTQWVFCGGVLCAEFHAKSFDSGPMYYLG